MATNVCKEYTTELVRLISYKGFDIQELIHHVVYVDYTTGDYTAYKVYVYGKPYLYYDLAKAKSMITRFIRKNGIKKIAV